jgi:hypothetical protein
MNSFLYSYEAKFIPDFPPKKLSTIIDDVLSLNNSKFEILLIASIPLSLKLKEFLVAKLRSSLRKFYDRHHDFG